MKKSTDHILTTHTGSLPRGQELNDLLIADEAGEKVDKAKLDSLIDERVAYVMEKQRWAGVSVANDGEQGRVGFQTYLPKRMTGFGGESKRPFGQEWIQLPLFTQKFMVSVGSSILSIGSGSGFRGSVTVTPMPISSIPLISTISPGPASLVCTRSRP